MNDRPIEGKSTVQRLFILTASLIVGAIGWFLMGESESVKAAEPTPKTTATRTSQDGVASTGATSAGAASTEPATDRVLARVGDSVLTEKEIYDTLAGDLNKLARQRHQLIARGVENRVRDMLIEREAEQRGMTREDLLAQEVEGKTSAVSDADVDAFYEKGKAQIRQPKERVAGQIRGFLAMEQFVDSLRQATDVEILTEPLRIDVAATGPSRGADDAIVTLVEFSDFECPYCKQATSVLDQLLDAYGDRVRLVYRHYPLDNLHPHARKASEASLCAQEQDKFWVMHDQMFASQRSLGVDGLKALAVAAGLEAEPFSSCLDSGRHQQAVEADFQAGLRIGIDRTPAFLINGRYISGSPTYDALEAIVEQELERAGAS